MKNKEALINSLHKDMFELIHYMDAVKNMIYSLNDKSTLSEAGETEFQLSRFKLLSTGTINQMINSAKELRKDIIYTEDYKLNPK